jgi:4-amino-4-deoxy-L-arabinose transferase-like glycosyltransferase
VQSKAVARKVDRNALVIFLVSLSARLVWTALIPYLDPFIKNQPLLGDANSYDLIAQGIMLGFGFSGLPPQLTAFWPPLYPAFLSLIYSVFGHQIEISRYIQAIIGSLIPVFLYLTAKNLADQRTAWLTGLGIAFYPFLIYFGAWLIAEALFLALLCATIWLASSLAPNWKPNKIAWIGFLLGLSAMAKPTTLFFIPFWLLWVYLAPENLKAARRFLLTLYLISPFLLIVLPWTYRNYLLTGQFVLISTNGGYTFLGANNPDAWGGHEEGFPPSISGLNDAEMEDQYYSRAISWIKTHPSDFSKLVFQKYLRLFSPLSIASQPSDLALPGRPFIYLAYSIFLLLALAGMLYLLPLWRSLGFLYIPVIGVILSTALFYGDVRYTLPMAPSMVFFSAASLVRLWPAIYQYLRPSRIINLGR